jgi:hypothetical protein
MFLSKKLNIYSIIIFIFIVIKLHKHIFCEICIMRTIGMKRMRSLPEDVLHLVLSHDDDGPDLRGKHLTARERALVMLQSFVENNEDIQLATNQLSQIDSTWIDSLKEYNQTDCDEYKQFKHQLELQKTTPSELKKKLLEKESEIVMKNVKKLKLFMRKYHYDSDLVEKIMHKLDSIIRNYYRRDGLFDFNEGAHPEYIMNSFIYNPRKHETRFKVLRIDGNQVTYQPYRNDEPNGNARTTGLDEFLKVTITAQTDSGFWRSIPIGEIYRFFPDRSEFDTDESYNEKVAGYLEQLMTIFAKKPDTAFFSVPYIPPAKPKLKKSMPVPVKTKSNWVQHADGSWVRAPSGGRKTHHNRHNKKKKRTYKTRK